MEQLSSLSGDLLQKSGVSALIQSVLLVKYVMLRDTGFIRMKMTGVGCGKKQEVKVVGKGRWKRYMHGIATAVAHCTAYHVIANTYQSFVFSSIDTGVTPVVILVNNVLVVGSNAQADIYHVVMH